MKQHDEVNNYVSMLKVLYLGKNSERTIIRYIQGRSRITLGGKKKKSEENFRISEWSLLLKVYTYC